MRKAIRGILEFIALLAFFGSFAICIAAITYPPKVFNPQPMRTADAR